MTPVYSLGGDWMHDPTKPIIMLLSYDFLHVKTKKQPPNFNKPTENLEM
jgi:hypothetical protein